MKYIEKGNISLLLAILLLLFISQYEQTHAKIVFCSKQNGDTDYHIYVMEDNGSNVRRITAPDFYDRHPRWFPDGKRILFSRDLSRGNGGVFNSEFYIIDAKGRNEHRFMENHPTDGHPALSPDGKQVAFVSNRSGEWDIYTYHLESGQFRQLTDNRNTDGSCNRMDWSPDGRQIAYEHDTAAEGSNVWIMNANGSRNRRLSPRDNGAITFLNRGAPRWSPSGKYIMYDERERNKNWQRIKESLVVQNVHTGIREVHKFPVKDIVLTGCWMGNDQTVLLAIKKDWEAPSANYEIYRYDLVSRRLTNLTNQPGGDYYPHWIRGTLAVFPAGKLPTLWGQLKQTD